MTLIDGLVLGTIIGVGTLLLAWVVSCRPPRHAWQSLPPVVRSRRKKNRLEPSVTGWRSVRLRYVPDRGWLVTELASSRVSVEDTDRCRHLPHRAAALFCECGSHVHPDRKSAARVWPEPHGTFLATVKLSGRLAPTTTGWRGQRHTIETIEVPACPCGNSATHAVLRPRNHITVCCEGCAAGKTISMSLSKVSDETNVRFVNHLGTPVGHAPTGSREHAVEWLVSLQQRQLELPNLHRRVHRLEDAIRTAGDSGGHLGLTLLLALPPQQVLDCPDLAVELLDTLPAPARQELLERTDRAGLVWRQAAGAVIEDLDSWKQMAQMVYGDVADDVVDWWHELPLERRCEVTTETLRHILDAAAAERPVRQALSPTTTTDTLQHLDQLQQQLNSSHRR